MEKVTIVGLLALLILGGTVLAQQAEVQKKGTSTSGMMEEMMKGGKEGGMGGMMRMMKMMDQCSAMMQSTHAQPEGTKESEKK